MSIEIQELALRYGTSWAEHDPDAIMARHTDDAVFHLHGGTGDVSCNLSSPDTYDARTRRGSHMFRAAAVGITALVVVALAASTAFAASPTKAGVYEGTLYASGTAALTKVVRLKVAATGKSGRVTWSCGTGRAPSTLQFGIKTDGTFRAFSNTGTLTVWSFVGRFVSSKQVRAVLHLNTTCDGKGGTLNLALKA